ncbi:MAG: hypothetical protein ACI857_001863 [Arenicella sp.]|jgi:hypothetical protein
MKKILITSLLVLVGFASEAQSGYLGSLNNIHVSIKAVPSIKSKNNLNSLLDESKRSLRWAYMSYELGYSRIISKKIEIGASYGFSSMKAVTEGANYVTFDTITETNGFETYIQKDFTFLEDPRVDMHQFTFDFRYFRLGSLSPTGKYLGFGLEFGAAKIKTSDDILMGQKDIVTSSNFAVSKYDITDLRTFNLADDTKSIYAQINANIGRNYPITQNLMIGVGMTFPVFTVFKGDFLRYGFNIGSSGGDFTEDGNLSRMLMFTQKKYKRVSLDLTIKYFI